ncbi:hypothetical protein HPB50_018745 [Hyalomma asiaticum]|uniref:Uncharacterized protein n=1 Tax=Hyalomma asiaticum TaxID=266040 RepID=A0ACB7TD40_HYAAI|nr:hypothetical protein HPB50_018745 [Hyalomma asiaticum]
MRRGAVIARRTPFPALHGTLHLLGRNLKLGGPENEREQTANERRVDTPETYVTLSWSAKGPKHEPSSACAGPSRSRNRREMLVSFLEQYPSLAQRSFSPTFVARNSGSAQRGAANTENLRAMAALVTQAGVCGAARLQSRGEGVRGVGGSRVTGALYLRSNWPNVAAAVEVATMPGESTSSPSEDLLPEPVDVTFQDELGDSTRSPEQEPSATTSCEERSDQQTYRTRYARVVRKPERLDL